MKSFLISLIKKIGYIFAAIIITVAILVCISRAIAPVLDQHRDDFEKWATQLLQTPVSIKNVQVSWYQYQPVISLNQVTVLDKQAKETILQVQNINILFSIPQSVWQWKLVPSGIMITGTDVNIYQTSTGEFHVQGFPSLGGFNQQPFKSESKFVDLIAWLSLQPRLILNNIDLRYSEWNGQKRFVTLHNLSLKNSDTVHSIFGKAILHQTLPTEVALSVQWEGQHPDLAQIKAKAYLYVSGFSPAQWIKEKSWKGWQINGGVVSAKIWATWENGAIQQIQSSLQSYGLNLYSQTNKSTHIINRFSGNVGWKRQEQSQVFAGDDILIDLPSHLWPSTSFYLSFSPDANGNLSLKAADVGYVDLHDVQTFLMSSPAILPESAQSMLAGLKLTGNLQNAAITFSGPWSDWQHISLNAHFSELGFLPRSFETAQTLRPFDKLRAQGRLLRTNGSFPGMRNLSGDVKWNGTQGELKLNTHKAFLEANTIFEKNIYIDQLSGNVQWQYDQNKGWLLNIPTLQLLNDDLAANVNGTVTKAPNAGAAVNVNANFIMPKANHITHYLPMRTFDADLVTWLKTAFLSGEIKSGHLDLRGPLADFPFDKGNGTFSASAKVNNIDFRYAPDWPILRSVSGQITFLGRKMEVDVDHAQIFEIPVAHVHGTILYLGDDQPQILQVQSDDIHTNLAQALNFVHASPLEKTIGKMFADVDLQGPMSIKLGLTVPLKNPDQTQVQGELAMEDAVMKLVPWNLTLAHLTGKVQFTENSIQSNNIQGELFNKPLQFSLATVQKTKKLSVVQASFSNHLDLNDLETWLALPLSKVVQGSTDVTGTVDLSLTEPIEIKLHSDLIGASVNLIEQYGKTSSEARAFSADILLKANEPLRMKLSYGNLLSAALIVDSKHQKYNLIGTDLHLGAGEASWPASPGISISGEIDKFDLDKLKEYAGNASPSSDFSMAKLRSVDLRVGQILFGGRKLTQANVQMQSTQNDWNINISSPDVVGQLKVPKNLNRQSMVTAQFQKIKLQATNTDAKQSRSLVNVKSLPAISFAANAVIYNDMPLGQLVFKAIPSANGLTIQTLRIVSPRIDLRATGDWTEGKNGEQTHLQGVANSSRVDDLVNSLGLDAHNFIASKGNLNFNLSWRGAPYAPSLSGINGQGSLNLGQGRIVDIGQDNGAKMDLGRMLSIFSLQTIPRRLSLDFSDIFQKGYSFDSLRGDFSIKDGELLTHNLQFEGPVARVGINGQIGLKNKDYNFILSITAHVTASLPAAGVAATLITGNPLIGLGAFAVNSMIGSQVSKATTYYYAVTGPWDNPAWKSVQAAKRK